MALTEKMKRFCEHYVENDFNATQAAIKAGYSEKTARTIGSENLTKQEVQAYIKELTKPLEEARKKRILSIAERKEVLSNIIMNEYDRQGDRLSAIDLLNKMECIYTQKVEAKVEPLQITIDYGE